MMDVLLKLLSQADYVLTTEDEINAFNNDPRWISKFKRLDEKLERCRENHDFTKLSIGEYFSRTAHYHWRTEESESIEHILEYIKTGETYDPTGIIGFIAAWTNSEIQHPIIEKLVKHTLQNNLMKYPLNTKVIDYFAAVNKKPNHAPKKDPIESLDVLMFYFKIKSVNGVYNELKMPRATIKDRLDKLVGTGYDYKILIDQNFEHYKKIEIIYKKWLNQSN
jgi:hypothetical protein